MSARLSILLVEPYFAGSHAMWAEGLARHSTHDIDIVKLSGAHWKWRMHGGAVTLARRFVALDKTPDLLLMTDMLDVPTFLALTRTKTATIPTAVYFHENQLTYPWSPQDRDRVDNRDRHYSFVNYASALVCDRVFFNSKYHHDAFLSELPVFLKQFPDHRERDLVEQIAAKSEVLPLGLELEPLAEARANLEGSPVLSADRPPLVLWNHRWEHDKNPADFARAIDIMIARRHTFEVAILGESADVPTPEFEALRRRLGARLVQFGYVEDRRDYAQWLWRGDILPVTSNQDFFGASVMEAIYCGCFPLLPRRLAFPELMPTKLHAQCLYETFDELIDKLDRSIANARLTRNISFRDVAEPYDWRRLAARYDAALESVVASQARN